MGLKLHNSLSRELEVFEPLDAAQRRVGIYCCGPTVYDYAHIGNWRTFVFGDLVRRTLEFEGYQVTHVMNVTDVDDKIIKRVQENAVALRDFTATFEAAFLEDLQALNCRKPHQMPKATGHIPDIIRLIERLMSKGMAYQTPDNSVYFSIESYRKAGHTYGQLVHVDLEAMRPGERVQSDDYGKEAAADFALWKARTPEDGDVYWESPWGPGRPGWHIECSAMSMSILGPSFDVHIGGEDLVFPHHEDEIAQSEGSGAQATGTRFVKYWLHGAHLLVDGKKMSKSLGNFFTLRDLLTRGFTGREIRYSLLKAHYRETFNFTIEGLHEARTALLRIDECLAKLIDLAGNAQGDTELELVENFSRALREDLNVSMAWATVFDWVRETNRRLADGSMRPALAAASLAAWDRVDSVLGIGRPAGAEAPAEITALVESRQAARKARDFKRADMIRDELKAAGWVVEDTPKGPRAKKL